MRSPRLRRHRRADRPLTGRRACEERRLQEPGVRPARVARHSVERGPPWPRDVGSVPRCRSTNACWRSSRRSAANQQRAEAFTARAVTSGEAERVARTRGHHPHRGARGPQEAQRRTSARPRCRARSPRSTRTSGPPTPTSPRCPTPWKGLVADAKITFKLATQGPRRQAHRRHRAGADRPRVVRCRRRGEAGRRRAGRRPGPRTPTSTSGCARSAAGLLGYAQFPGGPKATDGVVILNTAFGTEGTASRAVRQGPHPDPRGRALAQPAPHLGRHPRLQRRRPRAGHAELRGPQHRRADLPEGRRAATRPTATCS